LWLHENTEIQQDKPTCLKIGPYSDSFNFPTSSQFIRYSLENDMSRIQWIFDWFHLSFCWNYELCWISVSC